VANNAAGRYSSEEASDAPATMSDTGAGAASGAAAGGLIGGAAGLIVGLMGLAIPGIGRSSQRVRWPQRLPVRGLARWPVD